MTLPIDYHMGQPDSSPVKGGSASEATAFGLPLPILLALLAGAFLSFWLVRGVALSGDEQFYLGNATHIARSVLGCHADITFAQFIDLIVGEGWFVPGMSFLLSPMQMLFGGEAPVAWSRAWVITINTALLAMIARVLLASGLSTRFVLFAVAGSFLVPFYTYYMGCFWGELVAIHAAILLMLVIEQRIASYGPRECALWGFVIGCITLFRPQFFLLLGLVAVRAALAVCDGSIAGARRLFGGLFAMVASWCLVLLPWECALNWKYGPFFIVTSPSTAPFVADATYSQKHHLPPNDPFAVHAALMREAAQNGVNLSQQVRVSRKELTQRSLFARLSWQAKQVRKFYFNEDVFLNRFHGIDRAKVLPAWASEAVRCFNSLEWRLWLTAGLVMMVFPFAVGANLDYRMPIVFRGLAGMLALQPIVAWAHGRYHVALVPVISVFVAVALASGTRTWGATHATRTAILVVQTGSVLFALTTIALLICGP